METKIKVISQGFVRNRDIVEMFGCSKGQASKILDKVRGTYNTKLYFMPFTDAVPLDEFLKFYHMDFDMFFERAKKELELSSILGREVPQPNSLVRVG